MRARLIGMIATPGQGNGIPDGAVWAADNGCYTRRYPGNHAYLTWLERHSPHAKRCLFAVAPDVVGDAAATLKRAVPMLTRIRRLGYRAALAAQDGLEDLPLPWDDLDVLFLGGTTQWKLSTAAQELAAAARRRGKSLHMGRVNSARRLRYARAVGCASVDGTYLAYGPDTNLPKLLTWIDAPPAPHDFVAEEAASERVASAGRANERPRRTRHGAPA